MRATAAGRRPVRRHLHPDRRADGRAGHRPPGHPRSGRRRTERAARARGARCRTQPSILCADDLAPADTAGLDPPWSSGWPPRWAGPTSHTAIIARQLGIPCVVAVDGLDDVAAGTQVLIDGTRGTVTLDTGPGRGRWRRSRPPTRHAAAMAGWAGPGATADGHAVVDSGERAGRRGAPARPRETPAEGVGLFRTELCFLNRDTEPTRRRAGARSTPRCSRRSPATRSSSAPSTPDRTSR